MTPCPGKRSHINAGRPSRVCYDTCARFEYAVHLTASEWLKPAIRAGECVNHVAKVSASPRNEYPPSPSMGENTGGAG